MAFYPKSFDARVHLSDLAGVDLPGWPAQAAGISLGAPRIIGEGSGMKVAFLTQAGTLHLWDESGLPVPPFPIALQEAFRPAPPRSPWTASPCSSPFPRTAR